MLACGIKEEVLNACLLKAELLLQQGVGSGEVEATVAVAEPEVVVVGALEISPADRDKSITCELLIPRGYKLILKAGEEDRGADDEVDDN